MLTFAIYKTITFYIMYSDQIVYACKVKTLVIQ